MSTDRPCMVFHAPYPIAENGTGSSARPWRMLRAFHEIGYDVLDVTGHGAERARRLAALRRRLRDGQRIDFCYSESSTMPTLLTETHHLPTHPLVDLDLLVLLRRHGVPVGHFYRDVYWRFPAYDESVPFLVGLGTKTLYRSELMVLTRLLDRFYLPSLRMASYVPGLDESTARALPPGGIVTDAAVGDGSTKDTSAAGLDPDAGALTVLYIGNISSYYRMHVLLEAVGQVDGVRLILCTPEDSWAAVRDEYEHLLGERIEVVHRRGEQLHELFARADVCSLMVEPAEYRDFAAPIKLYEYVGHGKPILASAGTLAAETVETGGMGWAVDYDTAALAGRLRDLVADRDALRAMIESVRAVRHEHTWQARALQVASDLTALR